MKGDDIPDRGVSDTFDPPPRSFLRKNDMSSCSRVIKRRKEQLVMLILYRFARNVMKIMEDIESAGIPTKEVREVIRHAKSITGFEGAAKLRITPNQAGEVDEASREACLGSLHRSS
jgi:hypothetical protein